MKIASIRIQNFRSFVDEIIPLNDYSCLVGPNGAGKSTVLTALNLFFRESENIPTDLSQLGPEDFYQKKLLTLSASRLLSPTLARKHRKTSQITIARENSPSLRLQCSMRIPERLKSNSLEAAWEWKTLPHILKRQMITRGPRSLRKSTAIFAVLLWGCLQSAPKTLWQQLCVLMKQIMQNSAYLSLVRMSSMVSQEGLTVSRSTYNGFTYLLSKTPLVSKLRRVIRH